jgi:hypothetical protein
MASGKPIDPSSQALATHISDVETELANIEFRIMFFFNQRRALLDLLTKATRQAALLSMQPKLSK